MKQSLRQIISIYSVFQSHRNRNVTELIKAMYPAVTGSCVQLYFKCLLILPVEYSSLLGLERLKILCRQEPDRPRTSEDMTQAVRDYFGVMS
jgi:hypothetical protein